MAFWNFFTKAEKQKKKAANLYKSVVALSRNQDLFIGMNIEDSVDGRFNSITLHLSLILRRLKKEGNSLRGVAIDLVSIFVMDMDRNLREMGVGDLSVGKHIKKMTSAFYGRAEAYEKALESNENDEISGALKRNLYKDQEIPKDKLESMVKYVYETDIKFKNLKGEDLKNGLLLI
ncbi:MAG: ubiquinol-cytochrome C chaperone family protein [Sphingomonadales bacterium]